MKEFAVSKRQQTQQTARFQSHELKLIKAQSEGEKGMVKMLRSIMDGIKSWREDQDAVSKEGLQNNEIGLLEM